MSIHLQTRSKPRIATHQGQALVEFAFILPLLLILMLGVVQLVLVGGAALAVNQSAVTCARYAALNPTASQSNIDSYLKNTASPLINDAYLAPVGVIPGPNRTTGAPVSVTVSYDMNNKLFLSRSFFGLEFPDHVSVTQTMTSE
ncbi:MAG TPA: TadE/TadG family type IV pilus assembly protein [Candidatus Acidoferrales bacterium]|nr:TadE/TadG family type IV pilus assembly protein [Candidatus Acidoferrales bacterium]